MIAVAAPYRVKRLLNFMDPWADVENAGWQLAQSLIAVGRGEWTGVGLGNSVQKLLYLPEMHTDRSEEHTSELQSLMRISYAVFCLKKKKKHINDIESP